MVVGGPLRARNARNGSISVVKLSIHLNNDLSIIRSVSGFTQLLATWGHAASLWMDHVQVDRVTILMQFTESRDEVIKVS